MSIFKRTLPNFIISPLFKIFSSFFFEGRQERHKFDISVIFLRKNGLNNGLQILNDNGVYIISDTIEKFEKSSLFS